MSLPASIHSWSSSYYVGGERRWQSGVLSLSRTALRFVSRQARAGEEQEEVLLSLHLSRIVEIKMETSSFIFGTLTVLEEGNLKHWFGSLKPNRVVVYTVLEHFWRERLLPPGAGRTAPSRGRELIGLVAGAQRQLEDTGRVLSQQGEQFSSMLQDLDKMESDLGVADRLLSELESPSWWPFGKLPWRTQSEAKSEAPGGATATGGARPSGRNKVLASVPAVVSRGGRSDLRPGALLLLLSSLEVRDANGQLLHRFERGDVDEIRVHSPYEITVRQRFIGRPDVCCRLLSAKMPAALSLLEMQYKKKVEFSGEYAAFRATPLPSPSDSQGASSSGDTQQNLDWQAPPEVPAGELSQLQVLQPDVSQAEAQELRQLLLQLKSLALEAESELERQEEALDVLTESVDRRSLNIEKQTNRMKRLL
ncbi:synaptosomal-associated protein 47 [Salarias fasciatus]|uniref:Synaptosomal-associated protein 47 n=1 Tax=Salarias fasciatus TaxID=181472 RepID=A0A672H1W4_SALFA|nr:synaptosomal-associated protein 47 [Salarias fasciatus]XP_029971202.1 synaptosomal-associated protein 47 [Salarias fasciatus]XP_029971203.1 synaptosomal-associated protein 47 [Salarias fasciatus]XP_029971204.1 synaptosomal-associated protein 47 [Salarias fasciatus]